MHFNKSTYIFTPGPEILRLRCGNLRTAFLAFDMVFWLFSLVLLCQIASHNGFPELAAKARAINDLFGSNSAAFMAGPVIILFTLLYFVYARFTISWQDGLLVDDNPKQLTRYQFKSLFGGVPLIYLHTGQGVYILYPVTSQDGRKFPNVEVMKKEMAQNQVLVDLLKDKLNESGAKEEQFWFFTWDVGISLFVALLIVLIAFFN